jgi:hypothetical protein
MLLPSRLKRHSKLVVSDAHRLLMHAFILGVVIAAAVAAWLH